MLQLKYSERVFGLKPNHLKCGSQRRVRLVFNGQCLCKGSILKQRLSGLVPRSLKTILKKVYYIPVDFVDGLKGRGCLIPPRSMIFVGDGDFEEVGQEFKDYFLELADLQPDDRVLDVGCGIGRMAVPLTDYLSSDGEYWGFDIVRKGIDWCQSKISPNFENFHFQHSDVYNKHYNPSGAVKACDYRFPFEDESFDFVFLTSVFTHMLPGDLQNYLSEISRVLKPGGKCFITFFMLNEESEEFVRLGRSSLDFTCEIQGCMTTNAKDPEVAIAYCEDAVLGFFEEENLKIIRPIRYGSWCGRDAFLTYQDVIVATKIDAGQIPEQDIA